MTTNNRLQNKVALITSSAPGTCAEIAKQLAIAGVKVVVCGRNTHQGLSTVRHIRQGGGRATFILADIAVIADVRAMVDETIATYGRLDILINSISNSYAQDAPMPDVSESVWDCIVEPLLKGTFFCCQLSIPFLQQCEGGMIINIIEKLPELRRRSVVNICQGGVAAMTSAIAQQFTAHNVTANLIWTSPFAPSPARLNIEEALSGLSTGLVGSPTVPQQSFASVGEAVMYLANQRANQDHPLHNAALRVYAAGAYSSELSSSADFYSESGSEPGSVSESSSISDSSSSSTSS